MKLKFNITNLLGLIIAVLLLFVLFKKDNQIVQVSKPKTIVNNIKGKESQILDRETIIKFDEAEILKLNKSVFNLQLELSKFKRGKDTLSIIKTQDTLIEVLVYQGQRKDTVISNLKLNIRDLKYVSQSKDTLLSIAKVDLKKVKRQRNVLGIYAALMTGIAIIK